MLKLNKKAEPETRMKSSLLQALSNKFKEVLAEFQNVQLEFKTCLKEKISRQTKIVDNTLTDEQISEFCNDPQVKHLF